MYVEKMKQMGISATCDDIITSASATATYLQRKLDNGSSLYVIGEAGLQIELENVGFQCLGQENGEDDQKTAASPPKAVVMGLDRTISYSKLAVGTQFLLNDPTCLFIATNPDQTMPGKNGAILPGAGSLIACLEAAVGRQPDACIGKPSQDLLRTILAEYSLDPSRTCMVGDRLSTDILFGKLGGLQTLLVFSGVTQPHHLESRDDEKTTPDLCTDAISSMLLIG